eukprot:CAMPEP_0202389876 /NCGR_PEP_ID=MMETSP1127-20130417/85514_1 /ASSEMBLY_ACC=CAM_ASM_000462 /TAXON_ID=3047 /ORGANISM="Dunaliella tertiolecta, Strain CCMP1320" /LENGTH=39 /DNA_ID= /DNA_START= /DNA_END= /DNA_ORIENTATION=
MAGLSSRAMANTSGMSAIPSTATTTTTARPDVSAWQQQQ